MTSDAQPKVTWSRVPDGGNEWNLHRRNVLKRVRQERWRKDVVEKSRSSKQFGWGHNLVRSPIISTRHVPPFIPVFVYFFRAYMSAVMSGIICTK
jgi:hypothetical protein